MQRRARQRERKDTGSSKAVREGRVTRKRQSESDASHVDGLQESMLPKLSCMSNWAGDSVTEPRVSAIVNTGI